MARIRQQSEESKYIKRINEQLSEVSKLVNVTDDNPLLTKWSRAIRESGLKFSKDEGTSRYRIENSAENRAKVEQLQRAIAKHTPSTVGEYKTEIREELTKEARQVTKHLDPKAAEQYIKAYANKTAIQERIEVHAIERKIKHMLEVIYDQTGNKDIGAELSALTSGKTKGQRNSAMIYNVFGRISDEYRRIQMGMLSEEEAARAEDLHNAKEYPWE